MLAPALSTSAEAAQRPTRSSLIMELVIHEQQRMAQCRANPIAKGVSFGDAVREWQQSVNDWYFDQSAPNRKPATQKEVREAFSQYFKPKKTYNGRSYVGVFFKATDGKWRTWLDTADREKMADAIAKARGHGGLPTYDDYAEGGVAAGWGPSRTEGRAGLLNLTNPLSKKDRVHAQREGHIWRASEVWDQIDRSDKLELLQVIDYDNAEKVVDAPFYELPALVQEKAAFYLTANPPNPFIGSELALYQMQWTPGEEIGCFDNVPRLAIDPIRDFEGVCACGVNCGSSRITHHVPATNHPRHASMPFASYHPRQATQGG